MKAVTLISPTGASVAYVSDGQAMLVAAAGTTGFALSTNPNRAMADLNAAVAAGQVNDVLAISSSAGGVVELPRIPIAAGEAVYAVLVSKGSVLLYLDIAEE